MRFEYIGKTNTVLEDIDIQSLKMGQTETVLADEKQGSLDDGAQGGGKVTPIKKNGPQTPEESLAASLGQTATA